MLEQIKRTVLLLVSYWIIYSVAAVFGNLSIIVTAYKWITSKGPVAPQRRELPPECLNDPVYGEHCYVQIKNVKLHYVQNGDKTKPLMVFLHGFPDFWFSWRHQIKHFSKHYWTVAVDLRGYGDSEKPAGASQYQLKYVVNDVKNLITALGREKCIIVAHDWGAAVAWLFLLKYPEMVEKYAMVNMHPFFAVSFKYIQIIKSWYMVLFHLPYLPEFLLSFKDYEIFDKVFRGFSHDEIEAYKFTFGKPGAFTYGLNYYRANLLELPKRRKKADNVTLPKGLLIYTDNDHYIDISNFTDSEGRVENLELSFIKSGTHFLHQRKPEETNKVLAKFLGVEEGKDPGEGKSVQSDDHSS